jgi:Class III cytochrome C family
MRSIARVLCTICVVLGVVTISRAARADDDFFSSSPGPLSMSHAALDTQDRCNDCHTGGRDLSNDKCLACHDHSDMKARMDSGKGFHSSPVIKGKKCESCHLEHKGKTYDLMGWRSVPGGQDKFDHKLTGWPLEGKHAVTKCEDCHKTRDKQGLRTYLNENQLCGSCHK